MPLNVQVLEESFAYIKPKATQFASRFYFNLFDENPELEPLFANTNMQEQEKKLVQTLVLVVYNLRNLAYLKTLLKDLGERHIRYGTVEAHYPMVGAALLKTFEFYLEKKWTKEVKQAWTDAYGEIVNIMLSGSETKSSEEISELELLEEPPPNPTIVDFASTQPDATAKSLYEKEEISELELLEEPPPNPTIVDFASTQPNAIASRFNLKLLLIIFILAGLLSVGLVYYHSSLTTGQEDNRGGATPVIN
jgi:nitric oxide dioxygenase